MPDAFQSYKPRHMKVYGAILINNFGEVLLVRGRLSRKWSFPKGHCKNGETDLECAKRELLEETGLSLDLPYTSYHKLKGGSYFVFAVTGRPITCITDCKEIEFVEWWPLSHLPIGDSNVDVSIFRTLMKSMRGEPADTLEFLESSKAHSRINHIKHCIDAASTPSVSIPAEIPFSCSTA
jgi:ADP-ribose pyrophosphatase YjhB (NUDIX family)